MKKKLWEQYQAVYVHIPFCVQKCLYCDFASYANCSKELQERYVDALIKEIAKSDIKNINEKVTVYFGGGTPSVLSAEQLSRIVSVLKQKGLWQQSEEATIEANPGTVDLEKLRSLRALGFDRISMGVQSLDDTELKAIGRLHNAQQALEAVRMARQAGFKRINADVIYGLPGQSLASLEATLEVLTATEIDHISVYGLILEEGTPLEKLVSMGKLSLPDEDATADMYDYVQSFLKQQDFVRYEISNYARQGAATLPCSVGEEGAEELARLSYSRHNDVYWRYLPYAAFGASATGFDGSVRMTRPTGVEEYISWVEREVAAEAEREELAKQEQLAEFLMMGMRRSEGVRLQDARERFGADVLELYKIELEPFLAQGLVCCDEGKQRLLLTEKGMAVGNKIFAAFLNIAI